MPKNRGFTPEQMLLGAVSSIVLVVGALIGKFLPDGFGRAFCAGAGFSGILFGIGWLTHRPVGPKPYDYPKGLEAEVPTDPKVAAAAEDLHLARESLANARTAAERYGKAEEQLRWWSDAHIEDVDLENDPNINSSAHQIMQSNVFERTDPEAEGPWVKLTAMANELELALGRGNRPGLYPALLDDLTKDFNQIMDQEQAWLKTFVDGSPQLRFKMASDLLRNKAAGRHLFRFPDPPAEPDLLPET